VIFVILRRMRRRRRLSLRRVLVRLVRRRVAFLLLFFFTAWLTGAVLFYYAEAVAGGREDVDFWTALYWSIITMATVGYGDVVPVTPLGRVVAAMTAIFGIAVYTLLISTLADYFLEATVKAAMGLANLKGKRIVVVGEGPICEEAIRELVANGLAEETGWLRETQPRGEPPVDFAIGELDELSLQKAGVTDAEKVIICYEDDAKNIHATALVKRINPKAHVSVLAKDKTARDIMVQLGADSVVPIAVLGRLLASSAFEPGVAAFISDATSREEGVDLVEVEKPGASVEEIERETGGRAVAIVTRDGEVKPAQPGERLGEGDKLIILREEKREERG